MSIFKKEVATPVKASPIEEYYGNIDIDLLDVNDKVIKREDVKDSDFAFIHYVSRGLLTKTQFDANKVGAMREGGYNSGFPTTISYLLTIAPVLKFSRPLKEIFKNTLKDEKGRDIVYFSQYPIEAVSYDEKENVVTSGKVTNQKIHYIMEEKYEFVPFDYQILSYNGEKYIKVKSKITYRGFNFGDDYFIKLKPIKWLCDYKKNRLVCLDGLVTGVPYYNHYIKIDFKESTVYKFLKNNLLPDLMQFVKVPKLEDVKDHNIEIKDNILNMLKELLKQIEAIKDENDKISIAEDIRVLASIYGKELIKIKNNEKSIYGSSERELIRNGIMPYYVYIEQEIKREVREDNKEQESKEIEMVINKLIERANLINDDEVKNDIFLQIEELKQDYLIELSKSKRTYQRIDFNKPLEEVKTNTGEVKLTFIPSRPVLIKELIEKEMAISRRIDKEINNNELRNDLDILDDYVTSIVKR